MRKLNFLGITVLAGVQKDSKEGCGETSDMTAADKIGANNEGQD